MRLKSLPIAVLATFLYSSTAVYAHHGRAAYDMTKTTTIQGTVTEFLWANPHSLISIEVKTPQGKIENWKVEAEPPTTLGRCGWSTNGARSGLLVKKGDEITAVGNRVKTGDTIMYLVKVQLKDGKVLTDVCDR